MKAVFIVDPQYDFIDGTLPVPGAAEAMDALAKYLLDHDGEYACKIVSLDWHPYGHCSYSDFGGLWPRHCVRYSKGASIWAPLFDAIYATAGDTLIVRKGASESHDEYSAFNNPDNTVQISKVLEDYDVDSIDLCGLAGDICVLNTGIDFVRQYPEIKVRVLRDFSPSLDGGVALDEAVGKYFLM